MNTEFCWLNSLIHPPFAKSLQTFRCCRQTSGSKFFAKFKILIRDWSCRHKCIESSPRVWINCAIARFQNVLLFGRFFSLTCGLGKSDVSTSLPSISMWLRRYVHKAERFVLEPKHLFLIQFFWVLPYLFVSLKFYYFHILITWF